MGAAVWRVVFCFILLLVVSSKLAWGDFMLFVNLINYTNPSGLCAECQMQNMSNPLNNTLRPVCCDELPYKSANCSNTGESRCDTRFRWIIRPFGASLETRPEMGFDGFTDCTLSNTTCPFSEMNATFVQGEGGILGVTDNPIIINSSLSNPKRLQFFIQPVDSGLPNIIDSLLVNLDSLQLGGDFTEEMMFTGFHNISTMTMSFRVQCSPGFCGPDCTTTPTNNRLVAQCQNDSSVICVDTNLDPSSNVSCSKCLHNRNIATNCSTCLEANYDPDDKCQTCLPNYDIFNACSLCINRRYDPASNCELCLNTVFNSTVGCTSCIMEYEFYDPQTNCTLCQRNRNLTTNCLTCLSGFNGINCDPNPSVEITLVSSIAGGVGGILLLIIIVLVIVACVLVFHVRKRGHVKFVSDEGTAANAYSMSAVGARDKPNERKFHNPLSSELSTQTGTGSSEDRAFTNSLYESTNLNTDQAYSQLHPPDVTPPSHTVKIDANEILSSTSGPSYNVANYREGNKPNDGSIYDKTDHITPPLPVNTLNENYSKLCEPTANPPPPCPVNERDQSVYDEAYPSTNDSPPEKKVRHPIVAYEEIDDQDVSPERDLPPGVYDKTFPPPANLRSVNAYSKLGQLEPELPAYDVANNHHPQQLQRKAPPPNGSVYDTANFSPETKTKPKHDYIETSEFLVAPLESPSPTYDYADTKKSPSPVKHSYDYIENPVPGDSVVPPTVVPPAKSVYTNTTPGKVSQEAESHYDIGQ